MKRRARVSSNEKVRKDPEQKLRKVPPAKKGFDFKSFFQATGAYFGQLSAVVFFAASFEQNSTALMLFSFLSGISFFFFFLGCRK